MSWEVSDEELDGILGADADKQYAYFLNKVADFGEVWLVRRGEEEYGVLEPSNPEQRAVAVWPHQRYVEAAQMAGLFDDYEVECMEIDEFIEGMLAALDRDGVNAAVLPMGDGQHVKLTARELRSDLYDGIDEVR